MRGLKWLVTVLVLAALGWSAWWWIGARGQEEALARWFQGRSAAGWQAEHAGIAITGFPQTFHRRVEAPKLADPEAGWAWQAPSFRADSPAWEPTRFEIALPQEQSLAVPGQRISVASERFRLVLDVKPGARLELSETGIDATALALAAQSGWDAGAETVSATLRERREGAPENTYDLDMTAVQVVLPKMLTARLDPSGGLAGVRGTLSADGLATFDRPLDRSTLEEGDLDARTLLLRPSELLWGDMVLRAQGRLDADAEGYAEGEISLSIQNWQRMLAIARRSGALSPGLADAVEGAVSVLSIFSQSEALDLTLVFKERRVRLGPIPIAEAPRIAEP
ncbi:MAG: DUF2125 domain-containing protein [Pseudomonadota bacterium]